MSQDWQGADVLLRDWLRRARESQHSQHEAGKYYRIVNYWFAVPVIVITTALGTAAFASIEKTVSNSAKVWFGIASLVAAVLSALQTHFHFSERSETHKSIGARYGNIRREIEEVLAVPTEQRGDVQAVVSRIRERLDALGSEGPAVPSKIFNKTLRMLAAKKAAQA